MPGPSLQGSGGPAVRQSRAKIRFHHQLGQLGQVLLLTLGLVPAGSSTAGCLGPAVAPGSLLCRWPQGRGLLFISNQGGSGGRGEEASRARVEVEQCGGGREGRWSLPGGDAPSQRQQVAPQPQPSCPHPPAPASPSDRCDCHSKERPPASPPAAGCFIIAAWLYFT